MPSDIEKQNHINLLRMIRTALNFSSDLSTVETDMYAKCVDELIKALVALGSGIHKDPV